MIIVCAKIGKSTNRPSWTTFQSGVRDRGGYCPPRNSDRKQVNVRTSNSASTPAYCVVPGVAVRYILVAQGRTQYVERLFFGQPDDRVEMDRFEGLGIAEIAFRHGAGCEWRWGRDIYAVVTFSAPGAPFLLNRSRPLTPSSPGAADGHHGGSRSHSVFIASTTSGLADRRGNAAAQ